MFKFKLFIKKIQKSVKRCHVSLTANLGTNEIWERKSITMNACFNILDFLKMFELIKLLYMTDLNQYLQLLYYGQLLYPRPTTKTLNFFCLFFIYKSGNCVI